MESPRNLHDCYFYYYSTCKKGNTCTFRHEAAALGHETACKLFLEGKCFNPKCTMRHMKIQKPRSATPCYWESQPGGCRKPHCVFQHRNGSMHQGAPPPPQAAIPAAMLQMQASAVPQGVLLLPRIL